MIIALGDAAKARLPLLALLLAVSVFPVRAGTILGGSAQQGSSWFFSVYGTGFSVSGSSSPYVAAEPCSPYGFPLCIAPGTYQFVASINSEATPGGMGGSFTVDGVTTSYYCNQGTSCGGGIDFIGWLTLPDFGDSPPSQITVTTPFTSDGGISAGGQSLNFVGAGIATITLQRSGQFSYGFSSARYDFQPTPEPGTMILIGLGLAILTASRLRQFCEFLLTVAR